MRHLTATCAILMLVASAALAQSLALAQAPPRSPTLDRVRKDGAVRCGSAIRPGLAFPSAGHGWRGLHVEICQALAAAAGVAKVEYAGYALRPDFERIGAGNDDVAFLTASELFTNELFAKVLPGPAVFMETTRIMVWDSRDVRRISDLGGSMVCAEPGTAAERGLRGFAAAHGWTLNFSGWMELEEMMDAFNVGRCPAVAGEATALAALSLGSRQQGHGTRILDQPLAVTPVLAVTASADPAWASIVAWTVGTVLGAAPDGLPVSGGWLGLDKEWQDRVRAIGSYAALYRRTLGEDSPLGLAPGLNADWSDGGLLVSPTVQ